MKFEIICFCTKAVQPQTEIFSLGYFWFCSLLIYFTVLWH